MIKVTAYTNPETIVINSLRDLAATTTEDGWKVVLRFRDENEMTGAFPLVPVKFAY